MADSNKTEKATPQHRRKARERGQVTRSRELTSALSLFAVAGVLTLVGKEGTAHWTHFFRITLDSGRTDAVTPNGPLLFWSSLEVLRWAAPVMACVLAVTLGVGFAQGGFIFAPEALSLKFERMSPVSKMQQLFSPAGLSNALKSMLPFAAIAWIGEYTLASHWAQIISCSYSNPHVFVSLLGSMLIEVAWKAGLVMLAWSAIDYLLLWTKSEGDLKMTKEEVREDHKSTEGNPATKSRIRRLQRQMRRAQTIKAAETATVVVTNPTHYAVALKFEMDMPAPVVVAKGLDLLAAQIKEIAYDRGIPVMENRPLAQALYKSVEVGDAIPNALYHAVAEILVLVFKAQEEVKRQDARRRSYLNPTLPGRPN
jgi:flagellar biosynthetic protein FlhB